MSLCLKKEMVLLRVFQVMYLVQGKCRINSKHYCLSICGHFRRRIEIVWKKMIKGLLEVFHVRDDVAIH